MIDRDKEEEEKDRCLCVCVYVFVWVSLSICLPWGIVKQTQHIQCQHHYTTLIKKWQICLSFSFSHTHTHTNTLLCGPWMRFLSALAQPVRQATGKIMLFSLLGKSFEMWYIINIGLEGVFLSAFWVCMSLLTYKTQNIRCIPWILYMLCQTNCIEYLAFPCMYFGNMNYSLRNVSVRK